MATVSKAPPPKCSPDRLPQPSITSCRTPNGRGRTWFLFPGSTILFEVPPLSAAVIDRERRSPDRGGLAVEPAAVVRSTGPTLIRLVWLRDEAARQEVQ